VKQQSLVLVTVDCLRADHCGFYGYSRPTTPFLNTLAVESIVAPTAVVAGAPTYYSLPAILASRMPLALGRDVVGLAPGESTLATALQDAGYATAAFSAANPYISPHFGYEQGFEVFRDFLDFGGSSTAPDSLDPVSSSPSTRRRINQSLQRTAQRVGLGRLYNDLYFQYCARIATPRVESVDSLRKFPSADVIVDHAISWVATAGQRPFFVWLHLMDPHSPYYPVPLAYRELTGKALSPSHARYLNAFWNRSDLSPARLEPERKGIVQLYDAGIRWVDDQVARFIAHLKQNGLWDHCVFALTADHGEEFLEHGRRYHAPVSLAEEVARVPLLIRAPAIGKKSVAKTPFSHLHLAPTLLEILGVPSPRAFRGKSLSNNLEQETAWDEPVVAECAYGCTNPFRRESRLARRLLSVRDARYKLVLRIDAGEIEELYDRQTDGEEKTPLSNAAGKEVRVRLLQAARKHLADVTSGVDQTARLKARLRDLRVELDQYSSKVV